VSLLARARGGLPPAFTAPSAPCQKRDQSQRDPSRRRGSIPGSLIQKNRRRQLKPEEIRKLTAYFKRVFQNPNIDVKARPRKEDSAEVYVGDEFIGLVYKDEEDGDYNFSMAILDIDLN
jgi:hypothetical protein